MAIGTVFVEVRPDARPFVTELKAKLANVKVKVGVELDSAKARAELDKLAAAKRTATVNANADTKAAALKLDELARTRTATVRANVDKSSFGQADAAVGRTAGKMNLLVDGAIALGPALIPATAALAGLAAALAAPIATAGAGLGIFGALSAAALAKATKDAKTIADLNKKATAASDPKAAAAFTKQADAFTKSLPKAEQAFLRARGSISQGFNTLLKTSGANIFGPLTAGSVLLGKVLPKLSPITNTFGKAITGLVSQLGKFSASSAFESTVNFIARNGVAAFRSFAKIAGNVAVGVGGLIRAFAPLGTSVLGVIVRATGAFKRFGEAAGTGKSKGFQAFLDYVRQVGPKVGRTLGDVAVAIGHVVQALAPQGGTVLGVIDALAKTVARMSPGKIAAVAVAVGALGLATGKLGPVKGLSLLIAGLSYADKHSAVFHTLAAGAGELAAQLNKIPDVAKIGAGLAAIGAVKLATGGASRGAGGIVSKVLSGGVQKVFVVNMAEGVMGAPGKGGVTKTIATDAEKGLPGLVSALPALAIGVGAVVAQVVLIAKIAKLQDGKGQSNDVAFRHPTASNPLNSKLGPSAFLSGDLGKLGKIAQEAAPATKNWDQAVASLDSHFAALKKTNPGAAMTGIQQLSQKTGLSMSQLATILPKSASAFGNFSKAAQRAATSMKFGAVKNSAAQVFDAIRYNASKAGVSAGDLAKKMHTLPKLVQTKILTPGALSSKKQVTDLAKQFGLTPRQVKTIMQLVGYRDSKQKLSDTIKTAQKLNSTTAKPHVQPQGTASADKSFAKNQAGLRKLNTTTAKPHVAAQGTGDADAKLARNQSAMRKLNTSLAKPRVTLQDNASGAITRVRGELNGIPRNIPVSINIRAYGAAAAIASAHAAANAAAVAGLKHATGGWIHGPGTGTSDSIPAYLSNGEFVVNAAAARQNAALLEAINGRGTTGNRMAAGGAVTNRTAAPTGVTVQYNGNVYAHDPDQLARKQAARDRVALAMMRL